MKHGNTIQWAVIALALAVGLFVWLRPRLSTPQPIGTNELIFTNLQEEVSSNQVLAGVLPVTFLSQGTMRPAVAQAITAKAWAETGDLLAQMDGVKLSRSERPPVVVTETILDLHDDRSQFKGYNIETKSVISRCSLRVQVMDSRTGSIAYTKTFQGENADNQTSVSTVSSPDEARAYGAVSAALQKLIADPDFKKALFQAKVHAINPTNQPTKPTL